jgi:hypothetical protein
MIFLAERIPCQSTVSCSNAKMNLKTGFQFFRKIVCPKCKSKVSRMMSAFAFSGGKFKALHPHPAELCRQLSTCNSK